jgi:iron complex outermembrane receptor protein
MKRFERYLAATALASAAFAGSGAAWAQEAPPAEPAATPAETAARPDSGDIGDIIVTARRREETLQDTPVAITAINASMLENRASVNIGDLQGAAPNLLITQQNSGAAAANLSIRGLTYADIEKSQEPTVAVVVDGVFIGTSTGQFFDFFDIAQIEVLRGPQGTLFGRNTIGGVINIRRTRPTDEFSGKAEVSYGRYNTLATRAVVNVPIAETGLSAKAFYFHNESDGFYRNAVTGKRAGGSNNENYGVAILMKPGPDFDALLTLEQQEQQFDPVNANIAKTGELFCLFEPANECNRNTTSDLYTVFNSPADSRYRSPAATLEMNAHLGPVTLTSVTGYRKSREFQTQDFDASTVDLYYTQRTQRYRQISQELRAAGDLFAGLDYVVGLYYFNSRYHLTQHTRLFAFDPSIPPDVFDTNPQFVVGRTKSYAIFGDFNWAFAEGFRLSFGGRFTHDKKFLSNAFGGVPIGEGEASFEKFTPKLGVDWRPNDNTMLYASWSRGYRSGGFSPRAATAATAATPYKPETVDSYEIGGKFDLLDRRLQLNLAAFYSDYSGLQQNTTIPGGPTGNQTITGNVGSATIKGIEADFAARLAPGLRLSGTFGYLDAKFKGFIVGNVSPVNPAMIIPFDYSKNDPIYSPKITASLNLDYTIPTSFGEVNANVGYRYIDRYDQQISLGPLTGDLVNGPVIVNGNDPRVRSDRQGLLDASLSAHFALGGNEAYLTLFGRNLADDRGTSAAFTVAGLWSFASAREPRTYGATLGVKF